MPGFNKLLPLAIVLAVLLWQPASLLACATCYGASDSPLAQGMNWGIMTLLGVVFAVMCGIVGFFVHVGRRSKRLLASPEP